MTLDFTFDPPIVGVAKKTERAAWHMVDGSVWFRAGDTIEVLGIFGGDVYAAKINGRVKAIFRDLLVSAGVLEPMPGGERR